MAGERVTLWTSAAAAGATFVAVAISAAIIWNLAGKQRAQFATELAAINDKLEAANAKIDKASATVTEIKKITALETTTKALDQLNAGLQKTNAGLAKLQQTSSLDGIKSTLAKLDGKIDKTDAALASLKKSAAADLVKGDLTGIETRLTSLAAGIEAKLAATDKSLAEIKAARQQTADKQAAGFAARDKTIAKLESTIGALKAGMADTASVQNKYLATIAHSIVGLKATAATQTAQVTKAAQAAQAVQAAQVAAQKAEKEATKEVAVAPVAVPPAPEITSSIPIAQPLTVHFDDAGRANLAGQTNAVIGSLKTIMKGQHSCAISVAGYTDTLGRDDVNLDVSKERADMVAAKLKAAFAGQQVQIDSVGWGERQLKVWTPDGRREMANRRVEVSVDCKG